MLSRPAFTFESYAGRRASYLAAGDRASWLCCSSLASWLPHAVQAPMSLGVLTAHVHRLIAVYGLHVTVGMAGQINVAQSAFVGVGAFAAAKLSGTAALLARRYRWRRWSPEWSSHRLRAAGGAGKRLLSGADDARGAGDVSDRRAGAADRMARRPVGMAVEPISVGGRMTLLAARHSITSHCCWRADHAPSAAFNLHRSGFGRALKRRARQ